MSMPPYHSPQYDEVTIAVGEKAVYKLRPSPTKETSMPTQTTPPKDPFQEILDLLCDLRSSSQRLAGDYLTGSRSSRLENRHMAEAYDHCIKIVSNRRPKKG